MQSGAVTRDVVYAQYLVGVAAHTGELQQEVGIAGTAVAFNYLLFDLLRLGRRAGIVVSQTLIDPLLVGTYALPDGDFTKAAVSGAINIRVDVATRQAGGVAGPAACSYKLFNTTGGFHFNYLLIHSNTSHIFGLSIPHD